jgi:hypothetical protein
MNDVYFLVLDLICCETSGLVIGLDSFFVDELTVFDEVSESSDILFVLLVSKSGKQNSVSSFGYAIISFSSLFRYN